VWRLPDDYNLPMATLRGAQPNLPLFQTEFSTQNGTFTEGGFETAWVIHNSLVTEGVSAFLYWDLVWPHAGLVSLEADAVGNAAPYVIRDQYYSVKHYARFTDPGYVRVGATSNVSDIRATAFVAPDQSRVTVVLLNVGTSDQTLTLELGGYAAQSSNLYRTVFRPPSSADAAGVTVPWVELGSLGSDGTVELPSRSVVTVALTTAGGPVSGDD
jgi:glucuronoarabinoxylan endo-1,4-beta-xylanase